MSEQYGQQPPAGTDGSQSPASPVQGQPSSPASEPTLADVLKIVTSLDAQVRSLQGNKDKGIAKVAKRLDTFEERLAEFNALKAEGLSEKVALRLMRQENLPDDPGIEPEPAAPVAKGGNLSNSANVDTDALLIAAGIQPNDPDVTRLYREGKTSVVDVAQFIVERKGRATQQPNPAQVMPGTGGQSLNTQPELEEITTELARLMQNPTANWNKIRDVKEKQKALLPK
ncbi:MAG: hypothetical protein WC455_23420 [Dehalococcoidia bacterium]